MTRHLFIFSTKDAQWTWLVEPDKMKAMDKRARKRYLKGLEDSFWPVRLNIKPEKQVVAFFEFSHDLLSFAYDAAKEFPI